MQVHAEADCFWLILLPFSRWLQKFHNTDIVSLASARGILEPPSAVFFVCQNCYQMLVFCWHVFWQMHKLPIHKLVSRHENLNSSTMYSVFDWKEFEILSYRQVFLESTEISATEELNALEKAPAQFMALWILSGKGEVQFMPFQKLSKKCHFLPWFCKSNWSETYPYHNCWHTFPLCTLMFLSCQKIYLANQENPSWQMQQSNFWMEIFCHSPFYSCQYNSKSFSPISSIQLKLVLSYYLMFRLVIL